MKNLIVLLLFTLLIINGCNEKEEMPIQQLNDNKMLVFNSPQEMDTLIKKTSHMQLEELIAYEDAKGYKSFGRLCEEFYSTIVPENFKSMEEILRFVEENSNYLQIEVDEDGETSIMPKNFHSTEKFIMNENKMYQIGNRVYRVFDNGVVSTSLENSQNLTNIKEENILSYQSDGRYLYTFNASVINCKSGLAACGNAASDFHANGSERVVIKIWATSVRTTDPLGNPFNSFLAFKYEAYAQKRTLGIWFGCSRTINARFDATVTFGGRYFPFTLNYFNHSGNITNTAVDLDFGFGPMYGIPINSYFVRYNCFASIPKPCYADLVCN